MVGCAASMIRMRCGDDKDVMIRMRSGDDKDATIRMRSGDATAHPTNAASCSTIAALHHVTAALYPAMARERRIIAWSFRCFAQGIIALCDDKPSRASHPTLADRRAE